MTIKLKNTMENAPTLSSTTPLVANGVFVSPWIPVDRRANIRIGVLTDKNGTLFTQHSNDDGATIIRNSSQPVSANKGEFLSFHPRGNFFRVQYLNGGLAQITFQLSTEINAELYGVTQSLFSAPLGRNSFGVQARSVIYDYNYDESAIITPFVRDLVTVNRTSLFADAFEGADIDTMLWATTATGSGASTAVAGFGIDLNTGATANSTVKFESTIRGRFIAGNLQSIRSGIMMPDAGTVDNVRRWGAYDDNNGFFWELDGTDLFAVGRINGLDTRVPSSAWNRISTFVLGAGEIHSYEVAFFADTAWFQLDGQIHHVMGGGFGLRGSYPNRFENNNSNGSTTDLKLFVLGTFHQRYGPDKQQPRFMNIVGVATTVLKNQPGHLYRIVVNTGEVSDTVMVYDNTSAAAPSIASLFIKEFRGSVEYDIDFSTGLTIVTGDGATDITVVFD